MFSTSTELPCAITEPKSKISYIVPDASARQQMNALNNLLWCKIMLKTQELLTTEH
jgi:hypothetical protein